jgi:lipid-A-disaccharide synthase
VSSSLSIMFIAGDVSGDFHAASVVKQFSVDFPGAHIWGVGGPAMEAEGFDAVMPFEPFNKMGFVEVFRNITFFLNARKRLRQQMEKQKPDCLVCVDYPGFNMLMMKDAHKLGIPVIWYIAPMVWAWKQNRAEVLAKHCSHIACIFPFEVQYFSSFTSQVSFVGNPLIEAIQKESYSEAQRNDQLHLAIVPGSRWQEVKRALSPMVQTFRLLKERFPAITGSISHCANLPLSFYEDLSRDTGLVIVKEPLRSLLSRSDLALVTSGTATLEAALLGIPQICAYKTSWLNYTIFKNFLKIPYISLPNIIAGEKIIPECIQDEMNPSRMADELTSLIASRETAEKMKSKFGELRATLGSKKPSLELTAILKGILSQN